jgi:hypothetical protein
MKDKYVAFFNTVGLSQEFLAQKPEEKAESLYKFVYIDNIEYREEQSISMTYSKEFKDQFKQLSI